MGPDVCKAILDFLNGGSMPCMLNHTNIARVPKISVPVSVNDLSRSSQRNLL